MDPLREYIIGEEPLKVAHTLDNALLTKLAVIIFLSIFVAVITANVLTKLLK